MNRSETFFDRLRPYETVYMNNESNQQVWKILYDKIQNKSKSRETFNYIVFLYCMIYAFSSKGCKDDTFKKMYERSIVDKQMIESEYGLSDLSDEEFDDLMKCVDEFIIENY